MSNIRHAIHRQGISGSALLCAVLVAFATRNIELGLLGLALHRYISKLI